MFSAPLSKPDRWIRLISWTSWNLPGPKQMSAVENRVFHFTLWDDKEKDRTAPLGIEDPRSGKKATLQYKVMVCVLYHDTFRYLWDRHAFGIQNMPVSKTRHQMRWTIGRFWYCNSYISIFLTTDQKLTGAYLWHCVKCQIKPISVSSRREKILLLSSFHSHFRSAKGNPNSFQKLKL